ncbi:MAG: sigma-70 family RNA polymerase sigma factor [bacterium]
MPMSEDEKLLERINAGDRGAFDELVRKYQRELYFLALRMVKNPEDAEELTQKTFVKTFERLESFRGESGFKTWLYQVAINMCLSHLRNRRDVLELNEGAGTIVSEIMMPADRIVQNETVAAVAAAADSLPDKQRATVILRVFHELSYEEIGRSTGCSEQTAKVNFHYGIENLRKKLKANGTLR